MTLTPVAQSFRSTCPRPRARAELAAPMRSSATSNDCLEEIMKPPEHPYRISQIRRIVKTSMRR